MTSTFDWNNGEPSVLANDRAARGTKDGRSWSQVARKVVVTRTQATGANPGTIPGLTKAADEQRRLRKARAP